MKRRTALYTVLATVVLVSLAAATYAVAGGGKKKHKAETLTGYHETPSVSSVASGSFKLRIDDASQTISYTLSYSGLESPPSQAHIHLGQRGFPGGVSTFLCGGSPPASDKPPCPPEGTVTGVIDAADVIGPSGQGITAGEIDELIAAIRAGYTYANVHTGTFPGGEIRGQINDENQRED